MKHTPSLTLVIMGISGCGKTSIGKLLSEKIGIPFFDGDDFHPEMNIQKTYNPSDIVKVFLPKGPRLCEK